MFNQDLELYVSHRIISYGALGTETFRHGSLNSLGNKLTPETRKKAKVDTQRTTCIFGDKLLGVTNDSMIMKLTCHFPFNSSRSYGLTSGIVVYFRTLGTVVTPNTN